MHWRTTCLRDSLRAMPALARRKFTTRLPTAVYDAIAASGVPITQVIEEAVQLWLDRQRQPPTPELPEQTAIPTPIAAPSSAPVPPVPEPMPVP
jgi:hypothetical protein